MFLYSDTNKRYQTLSYYLKKRFGKKVAKITLDAGFSCPNIDGTKGFGGCTYCDSSPSAIAPLREQFDLNCQILLKKWNDFDCIAYFNSHTNTYAPFAQIKHMIDKVLAFPQVVGISIATRADCLGDDVVELLAETAQRTFLTVELGLQTIHDSTGKLINRCHTTAEFLDGYQKLSNFGINCCIHIINGLPNESHEMMLETACKVADLHPHSVKIHSLHLLDGTVMSNQYLCGDFLLPTRGEYVNIVCDQLELLPPETIIERVTGDGYKLKMIAPDWSTDKRAVINAIDLEMARRNTCQGFKFVHNII